jgi:hypothetical protein
MRISPGLQYSPIPFFSPKYLGLLSRPFFVLAADAFDALRTKIEGRINIELNNT